MNFCHNGVLSPIFSPVSASASPSAFPLLKDPNAELVATSVRGSILNLEKKIYISYIFIFRGFEDVLLSGFRALSEQRPIAEDYSSFK